MENAKSKPVGDLKISQDVIATITRVTALETEGVHSLTEPPGSIGGLFSRPALFSRPIMKKAIHIDLNDDFTNISISVNLKYGAKITEVCTAMQNSVKENVQTMTGMAVSKVNVLVSGIVFPEREAV